jgi:Uma2 family endonuclease
MATVPQQRRTREIDYPTTDGKPMGETELHIKDLIDVLQPLQDHFADEPNVYVGGNLLLFYVEGNRRKHVSPDILVALGVSKLPHRDYYLLWKERKGPDFIVELTSKSTKREDKKKKFEIYRDVLKVSEYFLFDPMEEYLHPSLQGYRLVAGDYVAIDPVAGRLPSQILGLHLERDGQQLRLFDPVAGVRLQTPREGREAATRRAEDERRRAEDERRRAEEAEAVHRRLAEENERLRREIEALRQGSKPE